MGDIQTFINAAFEHKAADHYILIWTLGGHRSAWFSDVEAAIRYAEAHRGEDCYIGVGLSGKALGDFKRCKQVDIVALAGFVLDVDYGEGKKKGYATTKEEALAILHSAPLPPSFVVHTGHGFHGWWMFSEPYTVSSDEERGELYWLSQAWSRTLQAKAAEAGYALDSVFDLSRVMRLPGTMNCKDKEKTTAEIVEQSDWRASDLEVFYQHIRDEAPEQFTLPDDIDDGTGLVLSATATPPFEKWKVLSANEPRFLQSYNRDRKDQKQWSASEYDMSLASYMTLASWTDQEIANTIIASRREHNDDLKLRTAYYKRTIEVARKSQAKTSAADEIRYMEEGDPMAPDALATYLGVRIERVIRYKTPDGTGLYYVHAQGKRFKVGAVDRLRTKRSFEAAIEDAILRPVEVSKDDWPAVKALVYGMVEEIDVGVEGDEQKTVLAQVEQYLESFGKLPDQPDGINNAAADRSPFVFDGRVWFMLGSFRLWLQNTLNETPTAMHIAAALRELGCTSRGQAVTLHSGRRTTYNVWSVPDEIAGNMLEMTKGTSVRPGTISRNDLEKVMFSDD